MKNGSILKLHRSKADDEKYLKRLKEISDEVTSGLLTVHGINYLRDKFGIVTRRLASNTSGAVSTWKVMVVDLPYEDALKHYILFDSDRPNTSFNPEILPYVETIVNDDLGFYFFNESNWVLLKKKTFSINHNHWHLIFYKNL